MGMLTPENYSWGFTSRHPATVSHSQKEPDQCLFPVSHRPTMTVFNGWPTLVLETGTSESLPRLQAEACRWFKNSSRATRIVIVIAIIPLDPQPVATQKAFCSQEIGINVTPQGVSVTGPPMLLQFEALFDVSKKPDVQLDATFFTTWANNLF